jgi:SAM-dependent methyltransferase
MHGNIPEGIWNHLSCPQCSGVLEIHQHSATCCECKTSFAPLPTGGFDFRLQRPRSFQRTITVGVPASDLAPSFEPLKAALPTDWDKQSHAMPARMPIELATRFPTASNPASLALDLGCGQMIHRGLCERQGYGYIGLDYEAPGAMFRGDAQSLPFKDATFEFILSIAVLQEVKHPDQLVREAFRVLAPGGVFIGSASYLETYSRVSYQFSHTALHNILSQEGFTVDTIAPNHRWTAPVSLLGNGLLPSMPRPMAFVVISPLIVTHRLWWWAGKFLNPKATERNRLLLTTGSFFFLARKPQT